MKHLKIAVIHDWLVTSAGAERVLERILDAFPNSEIFSTIEFLKDKERSFIGSHHVTTSFIQRLPGASKYYRYYLPLMPLAIEQLDLSKFDLIISSSHAVAKGVLTGPDQLHLCMCYSPIRYAWDLQHQYLKEAKLDKGLKGAVTRMLLHYIRLRDTRTGPNVDLFIAISDFVARRINKVYRRPSLILYPPVDTKAFSPGSERSDFYITASRMVPYKRIDLIIDAFSRMPDKRLVVIGDGPEAEKLHSLATPNIKMLGRQDFSILRDYMRRAKAFIFAAEEDFGIVPLEAQACGTPVIAFGKGGVLETVVAGKTGIFFSEQTAKSLIEAVFRFEDIGPTSFSATACRENAERFSIERFDRQFENVMQAVIDAWQNKQNLEHLIEPLAMKFRSEML